MKYLYIILILFLTNTNLISNESNSKEDLIKKAKKANIQAIMDLNKYYYFPETKEGFEYFKKWYPIVLKEANAQDLYKFAMLFKKYNDMFINGHEKYRELLKMSLKKGNKKARIELMKTYYFQYKKRIDIKNDILKDGTKEEIEQAYKIFNNQYESSIADEIKKVLIKKGSEEKQNNYLKDLKKTFYKSKKQTNNLIKKIYETNNLQTLYETAKYLQTKRRRNDAIKLFEKALSLKPTIDIKKDILSELGISYQRIDFNKSLEYLQEATKLYSKSAANYILTLYRANKKYFDKYIQLKNTLLKTSEGKKILADFAYTTYSKYYAYELYEQLAKQEDKDSIIKLTTERFKFSEYSFSPEVYLISKKWEKYIFETKNRDLLLLLKDKLSNKYSKDAKELSSKITQILSSKDNILALRKKYEDNYYDDKAKEYLNKAYELGDTYSAFKLADLYIQERQLPKAIKIYEDLINKKDLYASVALANLYIENYKNYDKAITYLKASANKGYIQAIKKLGYIYAFSDKQNIQKAKTYLTKAINKGEIYSLYYMGTISLKEKNLKDAVRYYQEAIKYKIDDAFYPLASLYSNRFGEYLYKLDNKKAFNYLKEAEKIYKNAALCYQLADFYQNAIGVKKDIKKALNYYEQAYRYDKKPKVAYLIATIYEKNNDIPKAKNWYSKANTKEALKKLEELNKK
ncbi:hypothetical protein CPU12_07785 [Malaciobacter molluscorum LMG 25693]|uniref:beta-lactamase n=1 Tax=Malaciobacter molluscorum LMG 25693 TaxID=870501 RepID=A0A2G1DHL3_9BACT|nr:tetratricopeptide repeat protein [Malaciobacter molluscorum]AXX93334.1 Sel1 domain-containing protein [Malaciobacter molluscorum LMG 25693]PHO17988.1 hypothetical protein CPU12_07785 [Malaciobacter molluscorum LMG 25693]